MSQVEVKILLTSITAQYGTLNAGDTLRTSPEFARHLVEDCSAAQYTKKEQAQEAAAPVADVPAELVVKPRATTRKTSKPEAQQAPEAGDAQAPLDGGAAENVEGADVIEPAGVAAGDDTAQQ